MRSIPSILPARDCQKHCIDNPVIANTQILPTRGQEKSLPLFLMEALPILIGFMVYVYLALLLCLLLYWFSKPGSTFPGIMDWMLFWALSSSWRLIWSSLAGSMSPTLDEDHEVHELAFLMRVPSGCRIQPVLLLPSSPCSPCPAATTDPDPMPDMTVPPPELEEEEEEVKELCFLT